MGWGRVGVRAHDCKRPPGHTWGTPSPALLLFEVWFTRTLVGECARETSKLSDEAPCRPWPHFPRW